MEKGNEEPENKRFLPFLKNLFNITQEDLHDGENSPEQSEYVALSSAHDGAVTLPHLNHREEQDLVNEIRHVAFSDDIDIVGHAEHFWLVAALHARKNDPRRAIALAANYLQWRRSVAFHDKLCRGEPHAKAVDILSRGVLSVIGNSTRSGAPVLTVRYKFHDPSIFSTEDGALSFGLLVEYIAREFPASMRYGIAVMEEMQGVTPNNIDVRLVRFLTRSFSGTFPLRISSMFFIHPPRLVKVALRFFSPFLARKYKAKILTIEKGGNKLPRFFDSDQVPTFFETGGSLEWTEEDQQKFVRRVLATSSAWPKASMYGDAQ